MMRSEAKEIGSIITLVRAIASSPLYTAKKMTASTTYMIKKPEWASPALTLYLKISANSRMIIRLR
ncbi:hypothetical protein GCM10020331_071000 [Ectobacillus funiculus]